MTHGEFGVAAADRAGVWGIGCYRVAGADHPYAWSVEDIAADTAFASAFLTDTGITAGAGLLSVGGGSEQGQLWPFEQAAWRHSASVSWAEGSRYDAFRTETLMRRIRPEVVVGVTEDVAAGLEEAGHDLAEVFAAAKVVAARPGAYQRIRAAGRRPWLLAFAGPAVAVECPALAGAHLDPSRWSVESAADGEVLVSAVADRTAGLGRIRTGLFATVADDRCECGRVGPRLRLAR